VQKIKEKATRRRGRGFNTQTENNEQQDEMQYESIDDNEDMSGPKRSIEGWILFITGIQEESTEDDIALPFGDFGAIKNIHLNIDRRTGYLKVRVFTLLRDNSYYLCFISISSPLISNFTQQGYALIEYETFAEAKSALNTMNGKEINGQPISVSWAFVKGPLQKDKRKAHTKERR
jgi:RNA-binding protein 8A